VNGGKDPGDGFCGGTGAVGIGHAGEGCTEFRRDGAVKGGEDGWFFGEGIEDVGGAFAALLSDADVDYGKSEAGGFHDAGRGVADHAVDVRQEAPVSDGIEISEDVGVGARSGEGAGAFDEGAAAGVGVGIYEDELAGGCSERGEECSGLGVCVPEDGDGVPCGEDGGRREGNAEAGFECGTVKQRGSGDVVKGGCAGVMHTPRLLAHGDDATTGVGRGGEVEGRELG